MPLINDKSRRWIIAIVMSFLMVAFALPSWFGNNAGSQRDAAIATVFGNEKITQPELELAKDEWSLLNNFQTNEIAGEPYVLAMRLFMGDLEQYRFLPSSQFVDSFRLARIGVRDMNLHPTLFALLKREAYRAGFRPVKERVDNFVRSNVGPKFADDPRIGPQIRMSVGSLLVVEAYAQQAAEAIKVTRPELLSQLAKSVQSLKLTVAVIDATEFEPQVPPVTAEQMQSMFEKFGARPTDGQQTRDNPFGFGYQQGNRIRLDYITIPRTEVIRVATAGRSEYQWDVEAQKYYLQNQAKFTTERAVTRPSVDFGLSAPAATEKVLRPFAEVRQEILAKLIEERADQLSTQAERALLAQMGAEYRKVASAIHKSAAVPASSLGAAYNTYEFLRAVGKRIEQDTGVRLGFSTFADQFLTREELGKLDLIGQSSTLVQAPDGRPRPVLVSDFLFTRSSAFFDAAKAAQQPGMVALEQYEPTPPFVDNRGDLHVFRVLDAQGVRTPKLEEVEPAVKRDVVISASQERAVASAEAVLAEAAEKTLPMVAASKGLKTVNIPTFEPGTPLPAGLSLSPASQQLFSDGAYGLLRADLTVERPRAVVSLPRYRKVLIIELVGAESLAPTMETSLLELQGLRAISASAHIEFVMGHFDKEATLKRTNFQPVPGFTSDLLPTTRPAGTKPKP